MIKAPEVTMVRRRKGLPAGMLVAASLLLMTVSLVAVAGCSLASSPLEGTRWRLVEWTLSSLRAADFTITASFSDGQISGSSGVNTYGGPCKVGPGASFSAGQLAMTEMAGPEPAMRAETAYLTLLGQASSYKVAGDRLTLYDKGENVSLVFEKTR